MKKPLISLITLALSSSALAQSNNPGSYQGGQQGFNPNMQCERSLKDSKKSREPKDGKPPVAPSAITPCERKLIVALANGKNDIGDPIAPKATIDGKANCTQLGDYTLDFEDCERVRKAYNAVVVAEQGMFAAQKVVVNENNLKQSKEVQEAQAKGDGQNAAIKAIEARNEQNAKMYNQQALLYSAAVAHLSQSLARWNWDGMFEKHLSKQIDKLCQSKSSNLKTELMTRQLYDLKPTECAEIIKKGKNTFFSNFDAKAAFIMQTGQFVQKALVARKNAGISEEVAKKLADAPQVQDQEITTLDKCVIQPDLPECKQAGGPRKPPSASSFGGNSISFGAGGADQTFDMTGGDLGFGEAGAETDFKENDTKISDVSNPFEAQAKEASGILNPAGAAEVTPGQDGGAAGLGGGGGGGGGGGSASLGDDLEGAKEDENKDPDIKSGKYSANYKGGKGGGAGFAAVKGAKEDANPFSSLFDQGKEGEQGGIEEDRSIASDEGEDSGLFQKISKKYGQMQNDKRIEYQNLE